jgi:hypothetical protein
MSHRPRRPLRPIDPDKYRQPNRQDRQHEPRGFLGDMFRGYLYFTNRSSCYILAACTAIFVPLCACAGILYWFVLR